MTHSGADIAQLLSAHGLRPSRALGQNFVADPNTVRRIARLARLSGRRSGARDRRRPRLADAGPGRDRGPGDGGGDRPPPRPGAALGRRAGRRQGGGGRRHDPRRGRAPGRTWAGPWSLVANLPYNVATPLVLRTCSTGAGHHAHARHGAARGGRADGRRARANPAYGAVSVTVAYFAGPTVVGQGPGVGVHPPAEGRVGAGAAGASPEPGGRPGDVSYERLDAVVRAGFGQRRKMLRRSLAGVVDPEAFAAAGIRPEARAEELDVAAWGRLAAIAEWLRAGQAHAVAARSPACAPTATTCSTPRW